MNDRSEMISMEMYNCCECCMILGRARVSCPSCTRSDMPLIEKATTLNVECNKAVEDCNIT